MSDLISIVVPIYKVEEYLSRCVDSIINQTYKNLEIILVDDGSPDNCPEMCDSYAKKDSRIKVIHKKNGGLSDARNAGMKIMTGKYVSFIDSDDWISSNFIEKLFLIVCQEESDIVECGVKRVSGIVDYKENESCKISSYDTETSLGLLMGENPFRQHVWNKLYKSSVIRNIYFPKGKINEDEFWTYKIFGNSKKITFVDDAMYFYFQREDSIIGQRYSLKRLDVLDALIERMDYMEKNFPELYSMAKVSLIGNCVYALQCSYLYMCKKDLKIAASRVCNIVKHIKLTSCDYKNMSIKKKIWMHFASINIKLCSRLRCKLKIGF